MDFSTESLHTTVTASKVCTDGYEVQNLISVDSRQRNKGFVAESFVTPPLDIVFRFICNVELSHIIVRPNVGRQRSTGFDIFSLVECRYPKQAQQDAGHDGAMDEFLLAKGFFEKEDEIYFVNRGFVPRSQTTSLDNDLPALPHLHRVLRGSKRESVKCVRGIRLRIWKTASGTVPAIGNVRIYGIASRRIDVETITKLKLAKVQQSTIVLENEVEPKLQPQVECVTPVATSIPQEFLDPLTCDIMILPVLLPSGNSIDQSSLDRHVAAESSWGRPPSDPFTGLPFTNVRRVLSNTQLKVRIDEFLLHNQQIVCGRTTGVKRKRNSSIYCDDITSNNISGEIGFHSAEKISCVSEDSCDLSDTKESNSACDAPVTVQCAQLGSSIDETLKTALQSLKSYTPSASIRLPTTRATGGSQGSSAQGLVMKGSGSKWDHLFQNSNICCSCNSTISELLYKFSCSHIVCRTCITELNEKTGDNSNYVCFSCHKLCCSADIVRIHI